MKIMDPLTTFPKKGPVIAIDGPAGTGKSSATKRLADALGFVNVDTGALYRAVALLGRQLADVMNVDLLKSLEADSEIVKEIISIARHAQLEFRRNPALNPVNRIFANGKDVTDSIRTPEISMAASKVSAIPEVREALLGLQRKLGAHGRAILEGRDIGTVIFPDADVKFYLTASPDARAQRRLIELEAMGADPPSFEEVKRQIAQRDHADSSRKTAPLRKAADALEVDTTNMTLDQVVSHMLERVRQKLQESVQ